MENINKTKYIEILDTTLRDGEQMEGVSFSAEEKLAIAKLLLEKLKVDRIEICSARVSEGELKSAKKICKWAEEKSLLGKVEMLGFVDGDKSVDWINAAGGEVLNLLVKGSLNHLTRQLKKTSKQHFNDIDAVFSKATKKGMAVNVYLEDWSNGVKNSKEYVLDLTNHLAKIGAKRIMLADTLGILSPNDASEYVKLMVENFPGASLDFHGHNDYGLATANSLAAAEAGAKGLHATINGLGERTGNSHLAEIIAVIADKTNLKLNVNEKFINAASRLVEKFSIIRIPVNKPIIGQNIFTHVAGVHADGNKKANLYVSPLNAERFGRENEYILSKLSGRASLEQNLERLSIELAEEEKEKVLKRIVEFGDKKRQVSASDLPFIIADVLGSPIKKNIEIVDAVVSGGFNGASSAVLTVKFKGKTYRANEIGDGGYDAFMNALRKIVAGDLKLKLPELYDYEVRIPPGGKTDALVEAKIAWNKKGQILTTVGIDSDQVVAAMKATEKMLNIVF